MSNKLEFDDTKEDFSKFIEKWWEPLHPENISPEEQYLRRKNKFNKKKLRNYIYLTLSPDKKLRNLMPSAENNKALKEWADEWFKWGLKKWYKGFVYTIESGSKNDHLHLHCVCELKSSHKHAELLKRSWARTFPKNQLLTTLNLSSKSDSRGEYTYLRFDDPNILEDKLTYFVNERKGEHQNLVDLGLRGSGGSLTYSD